MGQNRKSINRRSKKRPGSFDRRYNQKVRSLPREDQIKYNKMDKKFKQERES